MTKDDRAKVWTRLWNQYLVGEDWTGYEQDQGRLWHRQLHIFGMPFYYIDYALAETCALQLHRLAKKDPKDALERYLLLCRLGGTLSFQGLLEKAGLASPFDAGTLPPLMELIRDELGLRSSEGRARWPAPPDA